MENLMDWIKYKDLSEKTLSTEFFFESEEMEIPTLLHGVIGMLTEIGELVEWEDSSDRVGIKEEVADVFWYSAIFARYYNRTDINFFNIKRKDKINKFISNIFYKKRRNNKLALKLFVTSSELLDIYKKRIYYKKEINNDIVNDYLDKIESLLTQYCYMNDIHVYEILNTNINKLKKRFGDKFSTEKAINRDVEAERVILETK